jgi:PIN domain nuclease of toxin-antitoxin system
MRHSSTPCPTTSWSAGAQHRDPFDRLLAVQAMADDLVLASTDPAFAQFEGGVTRR